MIKRRRTLEQGDNQGDVGGSGTIVGGDPDEGGDSVCNGEVYIVSSIGSESRWWQKRPWCRGRTGP